ncbi:hypothetical protein MMC22_002565 [Lobaria immixta]|nr:hypothetical protein [Lobaria immixta]
MTEPNSPYSRDVAATAIRSFYVFLAHNLPRPDHETPSIILDPPADGWPDLDATTLAPLGKTAVVTDLLRHLPYLNADGAGSDLVGPYTRAIRYNGPDTRWSLDRGMVEGTLAPAGAGQVPGHVAVLTEGGRDGSWLLLDTETGTVTDFIQQERPERAVPDRESPDFWRAYRTLPVKDFFEEWKDNFRNLEWVAVPDNVDDGVLFRYDRMTDEARDIYRAHGWPDAFRRKECREALLEWDKKPKY